MIRARIRLLVLLCSTTGLLRAADPDFGFVPTSVDVAGPGQAVETVISFHNGSDKLLRNVKLEWTAPPYLHITAKSSQAKAALSAGTDISWVLRIDSDTDEILSETALLRVEYSTGAGLARVAVKPLVIKSKERTPAERLVDIQVQTALETLDSSRDGDVSLLITNNSGKTVQVTEVHASGPSFLTITDQQAHSIQDIGPLQSARRTLRVKAEGRVIPGKYLLYFDVSLKSSEFGRTDVRTLALSQAITVGVLGESAIEKVLGVTSFLFLPGWLALTTGSLLWRTKSQSLTVALGDAGKKFPLEAASAEYILLSVSFSLLFAVVLWLLFQRWFFVEYGLPDILWVWLASILIGSAAFLTYWWLVIKLRVPSSSDEPIDVLSKLAKRGQRLKLERVVMKNSKSHEPAFLLLAGADKDSAWISPALLIDFALISDQRISKAVQEELNGPGRPKRIARMLKEWKQAISFRSEPLDQVSCCLRTEFDGAGKDDLVQTS